MDDNFLDLLIDERCLPLNEEADFLLSLQAEVDSGKISEQDAENEIDALYGAL